MKVKIKITIQKYAFKKEYKEDNTIFPVHSIGRNGGTRESI